jgi:hypothetical protein
MPIPMNYIALEEIVVENVDRCKLHKADIVYEINS